MSIFDAARHVKPLYESLSFFLKWFYRESILALTTLYRNIGTRKQTHASLIDGTLRIGPCIVTVLLPQHSQSLLTKHEFMAYLKGTTVNVYSTYITIYT